MRIRGQAIAGTSARQLHSEPESPPPRRLDPLPRDRPRRRAPGLGARPDRLAAWAVVFGLMMALMAAATAKSAPLPNRVSAGHALSAPAPAAPALPR
ncbi:MAG: hypothetical protein ACR2KV_10815 [Solirubrobacteraceae bacterium]